MPTEQDRAIPATSWPNIGRILVSLGLGLVLLWLSVPQLMAAFANLSGDSVLTQLQLGKQVTREDLQRFATSREDSLDWVDAGRTRSELGMGYLELARTVGYGTQMGSVYLTKSAEALTEGLTRSPADSYAWVRLAFMGLQLNVEGIDARHALIMSILTGPHERYLVPSRVQYALVLWDQLDTSQQRLVYDQIAYMDRISPKHLLELARLKNRNQSVVLDALAQNPERQAAVREALSQW